ncbi:MAG: hypothetical protein GHCLOJNM_02117 [bacterium]|nr:hypothetical protein [bacterium]
MKGSSRLGLAPSGWVLAVSVAGFLSAALAPRAVGDEFRPLVELSPGSLPSRLVQNNSRAETVSRNGTAQLAVEFLKADWPNVEFRAPQDGWDWSGYLGVEVEIENPETVPIRVSMRVDNEGANGLEHCNTATALAAPGKLTPLRLIFNTGQSERLWGMRGLPETGPVGTGAEIDLSRVVAFQVFLPMPEREHRLFLHGFRLFGAGGKAGADLPLPFVDRFGQYKHATWPGKLSGEEELRARAVEEERMLSSTEAWSDHDRFAGWKGGPKLEATGWFRTEKRDGRWWLVTPEGNLFFSAGIDCVGAWEQTFVEKRADWFDWLPEESGDPFSKYFGRVEGAHSMADIIGGKGRTFSFYRANLHRKHGEKWRDAWKSVTARRLRAWGFNTVGNWSETDVALDNGLPYVASLHLPSKLRRLDGAYGYWGAMVDVYDPLFADIVDEAVAGVAERHSASPLCIGFFSDNELSWETVQKGVLSCSADQPARKALIRKLRSKHPSIESLNARWGTQAASWEALRAPEPLSVTAGADLDEFVSEFARVYFETIRVMLAKHAPHQLYLGCRFSTRPGPAVRACAEFADVVSFNIYTAGIDEEICGMLGEIGRPALIGEFHFGAMDRGMFHPGLVPTESQAERAEAFERYVRSALECSSVVGCHWFQYVDEPITGRWFDGENYNIGFVDVTDTPYPEMVVAARRVHGELYRRDLTKPCRD